MKKNNNQNDNSIVANTQSEHECNLDHSCQIDHDVSMENIYHQTSIISVRGARTHNLKNINIDLPKNKLITFTGISGSGKSSLAFDTLYAEGQRRYVESLSAYARQFLQQMSKPDVDVIDGLSPAIAIQQKSTSHNPRSTVGTITEVYDYLRLLFARAGDPVCPQHNCLLNVQSVSQIIDNILKTFDIDSKIMILAPYIVNRKGEFADKFEDIESMGFTKIRINGIVYGFDNLPELEKNKKHNIEIVIDRLQIKTSNQERLLSSIETGLRYGNGKIIVVNLDNKNNAEYLDNIDLSAIKASESNKLANLNIVCKWYSNKFACPKCDYSIQELEPRLFSFNSPVGACNECNGLGQVTFFDASKIVAYPDLSISDGAIKGWDRRNTANYILLEAIAKHYDFLLTTPWNSLDKKIQDIILYGSKDEKINFTLHADKKNKQNCLKLFEGIINLTAKKYFETDSEHVKNEMLKLQNIQSCQYCGGSRLKASARFVLVNGFSITDMVMWSISQLYEFFINVKFDNYKQEVSTRIVKEIYLRLGFLVNVGLGYLNLNRSADTLSGGETQRIRLASQIGSGLTGVMYVLDEPSIGLHQKDNDRLIATLNTLRDLGNTVIVVEHDEDTIRASDYIVDIGPGAGEHGGKVIAAGNIADIMACPDSLTGQFLSQQETIDIPSTRRMVNKGFIELIGARGNNLKNINVRIPLGRMICVTGVSGSGKSTLVNDTLYAAFAENIYGSNVTPEPFTKIEGIELFDKVINVDQSPIGKTPRSNPATYTGLFNYVRDIFAQTKTAKERGYAVGRFSFNVKGGRCESCQGDGVIKVEMHFLPDIYVVCDICGGKRYNRETLDVKYKGKNISEVLDMTVEAAIEFFNSVPYIVKKLQTLIDVGLGYLRLGQAANTLSGGEAQRVKLALELSKRETGKTLYILDEPTIGLHSHDVKLLLKILHRFVDEGNTVVVIEHNLDVIKTADWIIDLGPDGGKLGGEIIAYGTPEDVVVQKRGYTYQYLEPVLNKANENSSKIKKAKIK